MDKKKLLHTAATAAVVLVLILIFYHCPFSYLFGLSCPGCGMTRAFFSLLRFDFADAFYYHPLFPLVIALVLGYLLHTFKLVRFSDRFRKIVLILACVLFIGVYLIRLISGHPVVAWDFKKSLIYKIFRLVLKL